MICGSDGILAKPTNDNGKIVMCVFTWSARIHRSAPLVLVGLCSARSCSFEMLPCHDGRLHVKNAEAKTVTGHQAPQCRSTGQANLPYPLRGQLVRRPAAC
jgi:hypothetical protein